VKVLALVPAPFDTTPGQRFRIEQWAPHLRADGIEVELAPFLDAATEKVMRRPGQTLAKAWGVSRALGRRLGLLRTARRYDAVYVFREAALAGPPVVETLLARRGARLVLDYDDAIWVSYVSPANPYLAKLKFPGKTATLCRIARHVMAGNAYLADYARRFNDRVSVVPTTIDTERYQPVERPPNDVPVIGWTGSYSTAKYLELLSAPLRRLRERIAFRLVVVGAEFRLDGVDVECRPWDSRREVEDLRDFDVGVMPLLDTEWERGKCGLKALQYMALAIPCVVSPVGVNSDIVRNDVEGFTAATGEDWQNTLERLLRDPSLRRRLGQAARESVVARYSAKVHAPRVAAILREAAR
jgi:glycosyltransferase involved in cell wall biosynthesis